MKTTVLVSSLAVGISVVCLAASLQASPPPAPVGYADGVPRAAGNTAPVLAGGAQRTIAGRVCMDQFVLDVGDAEVAPGDEVVLWGPGDRGEPTAQQWADAVDTIHYELVTRIGGRFARRYPRTRRRHRRGPAPVGRVEAELNADPGVRRDRDREPGYLRIVRWSDRADELAGLHARGHGV